MLGSSLEPTHRAALNAAPVSSRAAASTSTFFITPFAIRREITSFVSRRQALEQAVSGLLDAAIEAVISDERGCMISTGLIVGAAAQDELAHELRDRRLQLKGKIAEGLGRWLDREAADQLAAYLLAVQQGIAVQARDGADRSDLACIKDQVMAGLISSSRP